MAYNRKQRLNDNIKAIETAFVLDREQRPPTARERLLLERYCGFGGLKCILNPAKELADAVHWAKTDLELFAPTVELHRLIRENSGNESEYKQLMDSLKQSVLTAFYTPPSVTEALADALKEHKVIPEKVLEPSAGIGAFVDSVLENNPKADVMAFEKDLLTGKILHHLHPEQKVRIEGFEKIEKPFNDYFDLAISNIPFGDVAVFDPLYNAQKGMKAICTRRIHNYFFVKALDTVRDGGLVAFITSQGVLNAKNNSAARFMMLRHADMVSAIRLPNNLFTENANTEVGSDLIILQKNSQKETLQGEDNLLDMVTNDENRIPTNNYFQGHPERIIHTTAKLDTDPFGKPAMIYIHEGGVDGIAEDLRKMLHEDFKKNLNLNRYMKIEETKTEEVQVEEIKEVADEKQNIEVTPVQRNELAADNVEQPQQTTIYNKVESETEEKEPHTELSNHQPPVQTTLFELWGMEEESRLAVKPTKKKPTVTAKVASKKVSRKKASPLVKAINPTFEVETKPLEKETRASTELKDSTVEQLAKPVFPGDEPYAKSGMNFSEYMAILSGNTDLLDKAKLEKRIASLEGERKSFNKGKRDSETKLQSKTAELGNNKATLKGMTEAYDKFMSRAKKDKDGNIANLITLNGVESKNLEVIGKHLQMLAEKENTDREYKQIGEIYGFPVKIVSETSFENGLPFVDNRFLIEGNYKYQYNYGHIAKSDPIAAANNFLNALQKIPSYIEQYDSRCKALEKEIPQLQEIAGKSWKKEDELKGLKAELAALDRKIQLELAPPAEKECKEENKNTDNVEVVANADIRNKHQPSSRVKI